MLKQIFFYLAISFLLLSCHSNKTDLNDTSELITVDNQIHQERLTSIIDKRLAQYNYRKKIQSFSDSAFVEMIKLDSMFVLDIRYATNNNFTKQVLYPCAKALLRKAVALQLVKVQQELIKKGYKLKLFDCYRPLSVQWRMWKVYPDRRYVADPKVGSWHNKGSAVDLTLCTLDGKQVEMGTPYDYFGKEAWPSYTDLPKDVLQHRDLLAKTMWKYGFRPTSTEWWHYSYRHMTFSTSDEPLNCK